MLSPLSGKLFRSDNIYYCKYGEKKHLLDHKFKKELEWSLPESKDHRTWWEKKEQVVKCVENRRLLGSDQLMTGEAGRILKIMSVFASLGTLTQ